jgi:hypothetical protein
MDDTRSGRLMQVEARGDTANEIELAALDEARQFFGEDVRLKVQGNYNITGNSTPDGKKYRATVWIQETV